MWSDVKKRLKRRLKSWRKGLTTAYARWVHGFAPAQLSAALKRVGVEAGDVLMVHSSFDRFAGFSGGVMDVVDALQQAVGPAGTLMMPTIPFAGSALEYVQSGRTFDVRRTPSMMGIVSELFRRSPGVVRSVHPTHSVAARGPGAEELLAGHHLAGTPCGAGSPWTRLLDVHGKILLLGTDIRAMTFFHACEELLEPHMPFSLFADERHVLRSKDEQGNLVPTTTRLFDPDVSSRRNLPRGSCRTCSGAEHGMKRAVGQVKVTLLKAEDVFATLKELAASGVFCYDLHPEAV